MIQIYSQFVHVIYLEQLTTFVIQILVIVCVIQTTLVEMIVNIALRDIMDIQIVKVWSIFFIVNILTYQHFFH